MKKYLILLIPILLLSSSYLYSEELNSQNKEELNMFSFGLGTIYQISFSKLNGNNYYAIRHYGQFPPLAGLGSNVTPGNYETGVLIGKAISFNTKKRGLFSYATGLNLVTLIRKGDIIENTESYEKDKIYTIGVPLDINFTKGFSTNFGFGFNFTININKEQPFGGFFLNLIFGDFVNRNYKPNIRKQMEMKIKSKAMGNDVSFDLVLINSIPYGGGEGYAIKHSLVFNNIYKQLSLVIPIHYMKSSTSQIMNREKYLFIADILLRKYFPNNFRKYYFDFGIQYVYAYSERLFEVKPQRNFGCISISLGRRFNITKNLYLACQINMSKPVVGDIERFNHTFQQDVFSTSDFIINVDFIKFGIEF